MLTYKLLGNIQVRKITENRKLKKGKKKGVNIFRGSDNMYYYANNKVDKEDEVLFENVDIEVAFSKVEKLNKF